MTVVVLLLWKHILLERWYDLFISFIQQNKTSDKSNVFKLHSVKADIPYYTNTFIIDFFVVCNSGLSLSLNVSDTPFRMMYKF